MAIKGKKKGRGGRGVATPPRPVMVPSRTPVFRRRSVRIITAVLLLGAAAAVTAGVMAARGSSQRLEAARNEVRQFQTRVEAALTVDGVGQNTGAGFVILPQMGQAMGAIQAGEDVPGEIAEQTSTWADDAIKAADAVAALNTGASELSATELRESATLMRQGLVLYATLARNLGLALDLRGRQQERLIAHMQEQFGAASVVFDTGWQKLQELRTELGIPMPAPPQQPPGMPGGFPGGGGVPGVPGGGIPGVDIPGGEIPPGEAPEGGAPEGEEVPE